MKPVLYKNRYGDEFTFTPTEDGNILWEGNFEFSRQGFSNDDPRTINMVDPSGGPFIAKGMKSSLVHEDVKGKFVKEFIQKDDGWIIVLQE
jgi:hypothetical protein